MAFYNLLSHATIFSSEGSEENVVLPIKDTRLGMGDNSG